eukprot:729675-Pleurochrysis_carterae.AAC.1
MVEHLASRQDSSGVQASCAGLTEGALVIASLRHAHVGRVRWRQLPAVNLAAKGHLRPWRAKACCVL